MIQDILPMKYKVEYQSASPLPEDTIIVFEERNVLLCQENELLRFPKFKEFNCSIEEYEVQNIEFRYLFSVDDERFFMPDTHNSVKLPFPEGCELMADSSIRTLVPSHLAFVGSIAMQLYQWYNTHRFCGRCAAETGHHLTERAVQCPDCSLVAYPKIQPAVIVAVVDGDRLLVTRNRGRTTGSLSVVAGFGEIGETYEDTIRREVYEETGIHVKNIKYYKSQPWGFSSTLLAGFYCELDGDPTITIDNNELSEAMWMSREELPPASNNVSITAEMIEAFRIGTV